MQTLYEQWSFQANYRLLRFSLLISFERKFFCLFLIFCSAKTPINDEHYTGTMWKTYTNTYGWKSLSRKYSFWFLFCIGLKIIIFIIEVRKYILSCFFWLLINFPFKSFCDKASISYNALGHFWYFKYENIHCSIAVMHQQTLTCSKLKINSLERCEICSKLTSNGPK